MILIITHNLGTFGQGGKRKTEFQMEVSKKEKRSRQQEGSWDGHSAVVLTFLDVLL